ncbi:DUF4065 domain-containing protein [Escherichia coli]|nr:DUF4065 domain-containing protein [Escherichia coli]
MDAGEVFDELSRADIRILDEIYSRYGHMNRFDLANMTHLKAFVQSGTILAILVSL